MTSNRALVWIRRDIRTVDHKALSLATQNHNWVAVCFVLDPNILKRFPEKKNRRVTFLLDSLKELDEKLKEHGSQLLVLLGDPAEEIPRICDQLKVSHCYFNFDFETSAKKRDDLVRQKLKKQNVNVETCVDQVIFSSKDVVKSDSTPYLVFTPYKKTWLKKVEPKHIAEHKVTLKSLALQKDIQSHSKPLSHETIHFSRVETDLKPGEKAAHTRFKKFLPKIDQYHTARDFPAAEGTSRLSVDLRFGTISIRELFRQTLSLKSQGAQIWVSELIWREFYQMILDFFPHVESESFQKDTRAVEWRGKKEHFEAWKQGKTGYPIVDAAMRCLNETGWMHNRLRMIVACFLTKDLLIDWRWGEKYFAEQLLDYDLAANNGGWQWSASTGTDAQPYFRIFNPTLQSQKFDPDGKFILQWCPELSHLPLKKLHEPSANCIVDHKSQAQRAIKAFKDAKLSKTPQ